MNNTKHEWRKLEKDIYLPKTKPAIVDVPTFKYFALDGEGSPNGSEFQKKVEALYTLSYGVSMSQKKGNPPEGFFSYVVYPLEGVWDVSDDVKQTGKKWSKDDLVYTIMIRQPDFVTSEFFEKVRDEARQKKSNTELDYVRFTKDKEGKCCQMMHIGSYDSESESFAMMEEYAKAQGYERANKTHREIYISDPRKTQPDKMKTVLRFKVK